MQGKSNSAWRSDRIDPKTGRERKRWAEGVVWRYEGRRWGILVNGAPDTIGGTRDEAIAARKKLELAVGAGYAPPDTKTRLRDLAEPLVEAKRASMRPRSFAEWKKSLDRVLERFGHRKPAQVTADMVSAYRRELAQGRSPSTVKKYEKPLKQLLDLAARRGAIQINPYSLLTPDERLRNTDPHTPRRWTPAELKAVLEAARLRDQRPDCRQHYLPLVATLIYVGCRIGEALALRWADVDLLAGTISIRHTIGRDGVLGAPKTRAGTRVVPIPDALLYILLEHKPEDATDDDWVFAARHRAGPIGYWNAVNRGVKPALADAGIADARVHDLRGAAISLLCAQGLTPIEVAGLLGHKDATTTLRSYAAMFGETETIHAKARAAFDILAAVT